MPKKALVTGAAGFVGAVVSRKLQEEGHELHMLSRPESDRWRLETIDAPHHAVDLEDRDTLSRVVNDVRPDWIFHFAAHGGYSTQIDPLRMARVNILGTMNLVHAALDAGFEALVNSGSSSEYGFVDHAPTEDERADPNSHYAVTKLSQTLFCRFVAKQRDVHLPTLRLYSVFGPYEEPTRLVPTLVAHGLDGRLPPLVSPEIARDFIYTDDVARAFIVAAARSDIERGAIFNIGTGTQTTIRDAVAAARSTFSIDTEPEWGTMNARAWDTTSWISNPSKIRAELGWKPRVAFADGLSRFATWMREHPLRYLR